MTNQDRKASLTMADLESMDVNDHDCRMLHHHDMNYEIFEEIYQDAEVDDEHDDDDSRGRNRNMSRRRSSITGTRQDESLGNLTGSTHRRRRHSTYNPRNRRAHRDGHSEIKEFLSNIKDKNYTRRNSFVNNLMDFNLSYEVSMAASKHELSPALNFSCPVLNYLREDDEDSIELQMTKRPSLISERQEHSDSMNWESFKDDGESELPQDGHELRIEYVMELPLVDQPRVSKGKRRQRPHSYKMLERRLSSESPMSVIKSFTVHEMRASYPTEVSSISPLSGKDLDSYIATGIQSQREQPLVSKRQQQCARGA
jgi:hypothetical protein